MTIQYSNSPRFPPYRRSVSNVPTGAVPPPAGEISQVVIRFDEDGQGELPVFHAARQRPRMRLGVEYEVIDRDAVDHESAEDHEHRAEHNTAGQRGSPLPEYRTPRHLTLEAEIKVPSRNLYRTEIEPLLRQVIYGRDLFDASTVTNLTIAAPDSSTMLSPLAYQVNYGLSKETMARVETQLRLFPER